jgi:hypothetical protein
MSDIKTIHVQLQSIHPGTFDPESHLLPWFSRDLIELFNKYAIEQRPKHILFNVGRPLDCHRNTLELATANKDAIAWFGFRLLHEGESWVWWFHSWAVLRDVFIDSGPPTTPALYVGIPWGYELFQAIPKKPGTSGRIQCLPPVLRQSIFASLREDRHEALLSSWVSYQH